MASIAKDPNGRKRLLYVTSEGDRKSIRLGKMTVADAREVKAKVEGILSANISGCAYDNPTAKWIAEIPDSLADKLAAQGLIPKRQSDEDSSASSLSKFLVDYMEKRIDVKPSTKVVWDHVARNLNEHFGEERDLSTITEGDAEDFKMYLVGKSLPRRRFTKDCKSHGCIFGQQPNAS